MTNMKTQFLHAYSVLKRSWHNSRLQKWQIIQNLSPVSILFILTSIFLMLYLHSFLSIFNKPHLPGNPVTSCSHNCQRSFCLLPQLFHQRKFSFTLKLQQKYQWNLMIFVSPQRFYNNIARKIINSFYASMQNLEVERFICSLSNNV